MAVHWTISFKSFLGSDMVLSIYDDSYTGDPVALQGAATPFETQEDDSADPYEPIRSQSGYVRFIAESASILSAIKPTGITDRPVVLTKGIAVVWMGFLSGEQYDQPWDTTPYEVELPVVSVMEAMKGIYFTQQKGFNSLFTVIQTVNSYLPEDIEIVAPDNIPIKDVLLMNDNWQTYLSYGERESRSTTDVFETKSLYDIVENWCKYFGMSLHEYGISFVCTTHDASGYTEYLMDGYTQEASFSATGLASLTICGANNSLSYSNAYRRVSGTFKTNHTRNENILGFDEFLKSFRVHASLDLATVFSGNGEVKCYNNGTEGAVNVDLSRTQLNVSGGQINRRCDNDWTDPNAWFGADWSDTFSVVSISGHAKAPALKFYCPNYITIAADETAIININANVKQGDYSPGEDGITKLHCKVRVGNYWLHSEHPTGSTITMLSWVTTETECWLPVENGQLTTNYLIQFPSRMAVYMQSTGGVLLSPPDGIKGTAASVYIELLANAEDAEEYGGYSGIIYNISGFSISVIHCNNDNSKISPSLESNTLMRTLTNIHGDEYDFECDITTRRGIEYGPGVALNSSKEYQTVRYDETGIVRRAAVYNQNGEIIRVDVRRSLQPNNTVRYDGETYAILSQSINWRDDVNTMNILKI